MYKVIEYNGVIICNLYNFLKVKEIIAKKLSAFPSVACNSKSILVDY